MTEDTSLSNRKRRGRVRSRKSSPSKGPVPPFEGIGTGYMMVGDRGVSNVDPFATAPTADNQWVEGVPHIMLIVADLKLLESMPTDPKNGGPYVMWKGTPYAHVMVPLR